MGIKIIKQQAVINTINTDTVGFCHEINLVIDENGNVTPNSFNLGAYGDENITRLIFDVRSLKPSTWATSHYIPRLAVYDVTTSTQLGRDFTVNYSNKEYYFDIPYNWTRQSNHTYKLIFALVEEETTTTSNAGNHGGNEIFVSQEFIGNPVVNTSMSIRTAEQWETILSNATVVTDADIDLSKPQLIITPAEDHYSVSIDSADAGNKYDSLIKRLTINNADGYDLDEGLDNRYVIFKNDNDILKVYKTIEIRKGKYNTCWIPTEVTNAAGEYQVFIIAQSEAPSSSGYTVNFKRWVSNDVTIVVTDNFLNTPFTPTYVQHPEYVLNTSSSEAPVSGGTSLDMNQLYGDNAEGVIITISGTATSDARYIWIMSPTEGSKLQAYNAGFGWADMDNVYTATVQYQPSGSSTTKTYYAYRSTLYNPGTYKIRLTASTSNEE